MKKALKILGIFLGSVVLLLLGLGLFFQVRGIPTYAVNAPNLTVPRGDSALVAEGKRLVSMTCIHCHQGPDAKLSGNYLADMSGPFGEIYSANITNHPEAGIGRYTDGELVYLLRTGIKRNGVFAPPFMPRFNHLSDHDMQAIIAYLRSDEPAVQAAETYQPSWQPTFLAKVLGNLVIKPLRFDEELRPMPPADDAVALGRYLVTGRFHCDGCHSPSFEKVDPYDPEKTPGHLSGGNPLRDENLQPIFSPNLTPDPETGLGRWTEAQFVEAVRFGKHPEGRSLRRPMTPYTAMTPAEARAIWSYLQTVPPVRNEVNRTLAAK